MVHFIIVVIFYCQLSKTKLHLLAFPLLLMQLPSCHNSDPRLICKNGLHPLMSPPVRYILQHTTKCLERKTGWFKFRTNL